MATILTAIQAIKADAQFKYEGEDISTLVWSDGNPTNITNEQIETKVSELQTAEDEAVAQKATNKVNALSKLEALGLSSAEIDALTK
jgi:antitoxin component HigA of HigAB toxin-antitoxin module